MSAFGHPRKYKRLVPIQLETVRTINIFMHCRGDNFLLVTINPPVLVPPAPASTVITPGVHNNISLRRGITKSIKYNQTH